MEGFLSFVQVARVSDALKLKKPGCAQSRAVPDRVTVGGERGLSEFMR